ncbi:hypothetical protein G7085_05605 [Tessaracoccus sp. HDW20]|nr:hypothetical protein [Tessaracoccus coleopterorum]
MREIVELFMDRESRDELGIGVIRDTIADGLFPGTSTLLTRARYLLFIPGVTSWRRARATRRGPSTTTSVD